MNNNKNRREQVYSATGVTDLLSSPVFYAVLFLSAFLGIFTIYGFIDNPLRLKAKVDSLTAKIFPSDSRLAIHSIELLSDNDVLSKYVGSLADNSANIAAEKSIDQTRYSLFTEQTLDFSTSASSLPIPQKNEIKPISLDAKSLKEREFIGIPLDPTLVTKAQITSL